jgi:fluoride ion exporter CrcB/FEX
MTTLSSTRRFHGAHSVLAVLIGGAIGTLVRAQLIAHVSVSVGTERSWTNHVPWTLLVLNAIGVYGATALLASGLLRRDFQDRRRLLVITGFFGGFTSYSSLYVALGALWVVSPWAAIFTGLTALLSGVVFSLLGLKHRPRRAVQP